MSKIRISVYFDDGQISDVELDSTYVDVRITLDIMQKKIMEIINFKPQDCSLITLLEGKSPFLKINKIEIYVDQKLIKTIDSITNYYYRCYCSGDSFPEMIHCDLELSK